MSAGVCVCVCVYNCGGGVCVCLRNVCGACGCGCVVSVDSVCVCACIHAWARRVRAGDPSPQVAPPPPARTQWTYYTPRSVRPEGRERQEALRAAQLGKCFHKGLEDNGRLPVWAVARDRTAEQTQALSMVSGKGRGCLPRRTPAQGAGWPRCPPACLTDPPPCNAFPQPPRKLSQKGPKWPSPGLERKTA